VGTEQHIRAGMILTDCRRHDAKTSSRNASPESPPLGESTAYAALMLCLSSNALKSSRRSYRSRS
jgi:hypothetical protein